MVFLLILHPQTYTTNQDKVSTYWYILYAGPQLLFISTWLQLWSPFTKKKKKEKTCPKKTYCITPWILLSILCVTRQLICGNNYNWLLKLNLIYGTLWAGAEKGLFISMLEKLIWFCLTGVITLVLLIWKWVGLFLSRNHLLKCWGWLSFLNWIGALTFSLLLKLPPRKLEPWFILWSFFLLMLLCISINLPHDHACNTVVMSGLVPQVATWNC